MCFFSAQKHQLEAVTEPVGLGEGLHWDADKQLLYFVDITNSRINKFDPKTLEHTSTEVGKQKISESRHIKHIQN